MNIVQIENLRRRKVVMSNMKRRKKVILLFILFALFALLLLLLLIPFILFSGTIAGILLIYLFLFTNFPFKTSPSLMKYSIGARRLITEQMLQRKRLSPSTFGYKTIVDKKRYQVLQRTRWGKKIMAIQGKVAVLLNTATGNNTLLIYPDYNTKLFHFKVKFNNRNFPGLIEGSSVSHCLLLPFMRNVNGATLLNSWRLIVVTDKGQVYHNFPARKKEFDGYELDGDIIKFEESAVWDLPGRLYPSKSKNCDPTERYLPCLPSEAYEFHPVLNTDRKFIDKYRNGGFGKRTTIVENGIEKEVSRFYFPLRKSQANSFYFMSGFETDKKMTLVGTYRSNTDCGVRIALFASSDGGRNWYCKYEFGDFGEYDFQQGKNKGWGKNFGNPINTLRVSRMYSPNSFVISKRNVISPTDGNKEPKNVFKWEQDVKIVNITREETAIVTTETKHQLTTGNIIALKSGDNYIKDEWFWMLNNTVSNTSAGNGLLFKVEVIDDFSFSLYEYVSSPDNPITCRHIHHINRIKDGWIIGTGEIYPNGWLLYMQMKEADTFSEKLASEEFKILRLNSNKNSVQRTLGVILRDDKEGTLLYASDHDLLPRDKVEMPEGRSEKFERNSTGIFKGKLTDIDDYNKFSVLFEAKEPAFFFKQLGEALVFSGMRGEFAISFDDGRTWFQEQLDTAMIYLHGRSYSYYVISDYILKFK